MKFIEVVLIIIFAIVSIPIWLPITMYKAGLLISDNLINAITFNDTKGHKQ